MPEIIRINGVDTRRGEYRQINLNIARLPSRTPIDIPIHVYRARKDGPVLLLLAGMHGDEIGGVEILRRMIAHNMFSDLVKGSVIAIPVLNVYGFLNFSRDVPDGKDVNRSFPGNRNGSLASRVAWNFVNQVFDFADYIIDFHTGGASRYNHPQIRCVLTDSVNTKLAKVFGAPFIIHAKLRDRSLRKFGTRRGIPVIVYEAGEALRLDNKPVRIGISGTRRFMKYLGMTESAPTVKEKPVVIRKSGWIRARAAGIFHTYLVSGEKIGKGQLIGTVTDPYGGFEMKIRAPRDAWVITVNNMPVVYQGDALFHIGRER